MSTLPGTIWKSMKNEFIEVGRLGILYSVGLVTLDHVMNHLDYNFILAPLVIWTLLIMTTIRLSTFKYRPIIKRPYVDYPLAQLIVDLLILLVTARAQGYVPHPSPETEEGYEIPEEFFRKAEKLLATMTWFYGWRSVIMFIDQVIGNGTLIRSFGVLLRPERPPLLVVPKNLRRRIGN